MSNTHDKKPNRDKILIDHFVLKTINTLNDKQLSLYVKSYLNYAFYGEEIEVSDKYVNGLFNLAKWSIDKNTSSYDANIVRNSSAIKTWRSQVLKRDNNTCQHCFSTSGILHAHHIKSFKDYPLLRTDVNNGLTLCENCHGKEHNNG